jgi:glycosyltransferase involved in cell wall biosynthesis
LPHIPSISFLVPTYNNSKVLQKTLSYFDKLYPQPTYYIFMTNNVKDNTLTILDKWFDNHEDSIVIVRNFPKDINKDSPYTGIALARQILLDKARELNVDYGIFIDDDIFLADEDFITKITRNKKDIIGGAYYREYQRGKFLSYLVINDGKSKFFNKQFFNTFEVAAVGGGCMCISNRVLMDKRLNFYPIAQYNPDVNKNAEDFSYCVSACKLGYEVWVTDQLKICHYQIHNARPWRVKK